MRGERSRIGAWVLAGVAGCAIAASAAPAPAKKAPYAKTVLTVEFAPGRAAIALEKRGPAVRIEIVSGLSHYQTAAYVPALRKAAGWLKRLWRVR
jgi:hypothetical protein